ncbi:hypothetical protein BJ138DRAFT_1107491 [Hygrophoropsis aurantiaca]|uniref:Uncharacterized protein n=1 Tax=Hygrophoropsis aurantiaca TaxID=72124 RepID=A0ACB7ZRF3_9AGAM|nr:hypothetical protein BJ138DRAFT_1107491 [Hygrophoropsis aurantiaca]
MPLAISVSTMPSTNTNLKPRRITGNGPNSTTGQTHAYARANYSPADCFPEHNSPISSYDNQQWSQHQPNFIRSVEHMGARTVQSTHSAQEPDQRDRPWSPAQQSEPASTGETEQQPDLNTSKLPESQGPVRPGDADTVASPLEVSSSPTPLGKENHPVNTNNNICGSKRVHDDSVNCGEEMTPSRTKVLKTHKSKATESDLAPMELKICKRAYPYHRALLSTENPLPDPETTGAEILAIKAYNAALQDLSATINPDLLSPFKEPSDIVINILSQRGSTLRGKVVTAAKNLVATMYNIEKPCAESDTNGVNRIREHVTSLVDRSAYVYKNPLTRSGGLYGHPIILEILCRVWFKEKSKSDGIRYAETYYNVEGKGIPFITIALITTAVRCALDEWLQGVFSETHFKCDKYLKIFQKELQTLLDWDKYTTNTGSHLASKLRIDLFEKARAYAGVPVAINAHVATMGAADFAANENQI